MAPPRRSVLVDVVMDDLHIVFRQAEQVAQQFERMFIAEMLGPMFQGLETDGPFSGGNAEATFRPMLIDQYADAIAKGGGVGIAMPCKYRVATEHTRFAMPETGIGLFPDVGGGWYLSRLEGRVGQFLALTGARIAGAGCLALGLATHYLTSNLLAEAKSRIATEDVERIDGILGTLSVTPPDSKIVETIVQINRHFASDRLEDILASLEGDESDWAMKELATLRSKSPQTCKVALRQLAESLKLTDFADNMAMEYRIASRVLVRPDFAEGVRAVIVDKDNSPKWDPATAEGVTDALIDAIFAPLPAQEEWKPL